MNLEVKLKCRVGPERVAVHGILDVYTETWAFIVKLNYRVSLYSRHVLPRLINFAMSQEEITRLRAAHVPAAYGVVLEVGIGSGLNLPFYAAGVTKVVGVDPSRELLTMALQRAAAAPFSVELLQREATGLPLPDNSVDNAVMTWSLCSISDPAATLGEIRRLLKPDGSLIFVEHGLSPDAAVRKWQNHLTPVWRHVAGGCHLNRNVEHLILAAGFVMTELETGYIRGPRPATYMYRGLATKEQ